jgi:hypothetical protein
MSLDSRVSRRRRGLSPEINPIVEIGRRNVVLSTQQSALRRTLSDSSSSSFFLHLSSTRWHLVVALVALEVLPPLSLHLRQ